MIMKISEVLWPRSALGIASVTIVPRERLVFDFVAHAVVLSPSHGRAVAEREVVATAHGCVALVLGYFEFVLSEKLIEVVDGVLEVLVFRAGVTAAPSLADARQRQERSQSCEAELLQCSRLVCDQTGSLTCCLPCCMPGKYVGVSQRINKVD